MITYAVRFYRILVLHQVPQQSVAFLTDVVQVDVVHIVATAAAARVLVFMNSWTFTQTPQTDVDTTLNTPQLFKELLNQFHTMVSTVMCFEITPKTNSLKQKLSSLVPEVQRGSSSVQLTLHQVLMVDGGQVGEVLLEV